MEQQRAESLENQRQMQINIWVKETSQQGKKRQNTKSERERESVFGDETNYKRDRDSQLNK